MTTTLTFTEDDGQEAVEDALNGWRYKSQLNTIREQLRMQTKHNDRVDPYTLDLVQQIIRDACHD